MHIHFISQKHFDFPHPTQHIIFAALLVFHTPRYTSKYTSVLQHTNAGIEIYSPEDMQSALSSLAQSLDNYLNSFSSHPFLLYRCGAFIPIHPQRFIMRIDSPRSLKYFECFFFSLFFFILLLSIRFGLYMLEFMKPHSRYVRQLNDVLSNISNETATIPYIATKKKHTHKPATQKKYRSQKKAHRMRISYMVPGHVASALADCATFLSTRFWVVGRGLGLFGMQIV